MSNTLDPKTEPSDPMVYEIKIKGHLGDQWADWFGDVVITLGENGETLLTCSVIDQSALYGLLRKVRDLGMPLISVIRIEPDPSTVPDVNPENFSISFKQGEKHMNTNRQTAIMIGVLFILAAVTSIVGLVLYQPLLSDPNYLIKGAENANQIILGVLFELVLVCSAVGTTILLFPYLRKYNESIALGYLCFRFLEAVIITIGIVSVLSLLSLSREFVSTADPNLSSFQASGRLLIAAHDWTFILGPNFMLGVNTMMYSYLLYQSKLVPRFISILGLTASTLILVAAVLELFGVILQLSAWGAILALPVFAFEMTLAVWLITKGFNASPIPSTSVKTEANQLLVQHT